MKELKLYIKMFFVGAVITSMGVLFLNKSSNLLTLSFVTIGGLLAVIGRYLYQVESVENSAKKHLELKDGQEKISEEITGGNSYPKFILINNIIDSSYYDISLIVSGDTPLRNLSFNIIDKIAANEVLSNYRKKDISTLNSTQRQKYFSALHPVSSSKKENYNSDGMTNPIGQIKFSNLRNDYELCFMSSAENGRFFQRTKFERDENGKWKTKGYKISKMNKDPNKPGTTLEKHPK